jgi:hypothetical protein
MNKLDQPRPRAARLLDEIESVLLASALRR